MITARDYFYQVIAPEHGYKSYQEVYHRFDPNTLPASLPPPLIRGLDIGSEIRTHVPQRSNDFLIEHYMEEIIRLAPRTLHARLDRMFTAKIRDLDANAAALANRGSYDGDLIFFNVGLSDACFQYAILYYEFIRLISERTHLGRDHPKIMELTTSVQEHAIKLAVAQERWNKEGIVGLTPDDVIFSDEEVEGKAITIATFADRFILYHEISHHIFGHTDQGMNLFAFIDELPDKCKGWTTTEIESHTHEYQADAGALLVTLKERSSDTEKEKDKEISIAVGGLLVFSVLGQFVEDIDSSSDTHPPLSSRFDRCVDILREYCINKQLINDIIDDMKRFQYLLWTLQKRGLGKLYSVAEFE